ncbi:hypothetical protein [Burkholderia lata]|uniref:Thiazole biosynthesis protein ThiJ n=1 Tax=Burkholderia lata (strain ATCC 17760 / DSM 23089 / LMG 22485 / NCIMB 9086 / R18194 / 383) TaxID=482957 RepID=A0A6P2PEN8_BURL3|nr:hypothetical protein [Burkholderia lata]VWC00136.1 thiazole biosynthesis protein ThiJ [Burkholderia lata]VWC07316.1 thiazole biosynthesis protein ThiJ [Burkholderia lata]
MNSTSSRATFAETAQVDDPRYLVDGSVMMASGMAAPILASVAWMNALAGTVAAREIVSKHGCRCRHNW